MSDTSFMKNYRLNCKKSNTKLMVKTTFNRRLDINADRLDTQDWTPLLKSIREDLTLHEVTIRSDYNDKKRKFASQWEEPLFYRKNIILDLIEVISHSLKYSDVLVMVKFYNIPLRINHVSILGEGIKNCTCLQNFGLPKCFIGDESLKELCGSIREHIGLKTLDLTECNLTKSGMKYLADVIHSQKLVRYSETWKQSLRYREPKPDLLPGLRRIILNGNTSIQDEGFHTLATELTDDLWIKAVDMQNCGLSNLSSAAVVHISETNDVLSVLDIRKNNINQQLLKNIRLIPSGPQNSGTSSYTWSECSTELSRSTGKKSNLNLLSIKT